MNPKASAFYEGNEANLVGAATDYVFSNVITTTALYKMIAKQCFKFNRLLGKLEDTVSAENF